MRTQIILVTMYQDDVHTEASVKANQMFQELVTRIMQDCDRHLKNGAKVTQTSSNTTVTFDYRQV